MADLATREAAHTGSGHAFANEHSHHPTLKTYFVTFALLMGLLFLTVGAYYFDVNRFIHIPGINANLVIAMVIAVAKAALVVLFFMNVKQSSRLTWLWASIGFVWLLILAGIILDYGTREMVKIQGWQ